MVLHRGSPLFCQLFFLLFVCCIVSSCRAGKEVVKEIKFQKNLEVWVIPDFEKAGIKRLAILPFESPVFSSVKIDVEGTCSFCGHPLEEHKDFSMAAERLAEYLYQEMAKRTLTYELVPLEEVFSALSLQEKKVKPFSDVRFAMDFGRKLGVDAVVIGEVLRIRERQGENYSVLEPASVSFKMKMIRVVDGVALYKGLFDETQKPLSEEPERLFRWSKIRFRWQTAEELSRAGMQEAARSFPGVEKTEQ